MRSSVSMSWGQAMFCADLWDEPLLNANARELESVSALIRAPSRLIEVRAARSATLMNHGTSLFKTSRKCPRILRAFAFNDFFR